MLHAARPSRPSPESPQRDPSRRRRRSRSRNRRFMTILVVLAMVLVPVDFSYGQALVAPGQATVSVRTVEWLRDHGAGPLVNTVENWCYARNRPVGTAPDPTSLPSVAGPGAPVGARPAALPLTGAARLPGEAVWVPSAQRVGGSPPVYTAYFRPDPQSPSVVAGVAWMNQSLVQTRLIAGTTDPAPAGSATTVDNAGAQVPLGLRSGCAPHCWPPSTPASNSRTPAAASTPTDARSNRCAPTPPLWPSTPLGGSTSADGAAT